MTPAKLVAAAAWAERIVCLLGIAIGDDSHDFRRGAALLDQLGHHRHGRASVHEEQFKPFAKIVLSRLSVARNAKPVLGAATIAKVPHFTVLALLREQVALVITELALLRRRHHFQKSLLMDVAEQVFRFNEMVARVEITVVLQRGSVPAGWGVDAQQVAAEKGLKRYIEQLNKHLAYIMANPLLEDVDEELAVLPTADGPVGYHVAGLRVKHALATSLLTPSQVCDIDRVRVGSLDNGDELDPLCAHLVAKETINRTTVFFVCGVHRA